MGLGKLPVPGQRPTALAVGAGGGCLDNFTLDYPFSPLSPSRWETVRYRLKYCLKGPLTPPPPKKKKQKKKNNQNPSNQGWSGGAMVLGKLPVPGRPTI